MQATSIVDILQLGSAAPNTSYMLGHFLSPFLDAHKRAVRQRAGRGGDTRLGSPSGALGAGLATALRRPCGRRWTLLSRRTAQEGRGQRGGVVTGVARPCPSPGCAEGRGPQRGVPARPLRGVQSDSALASMSFVPVAADCDFPIHNLPYGVFSTSGNVSGGRGEGAGGRAAPCTSASPQASTVSAGRPGADSGVRGLRSPGAGVRVGAGRAGPGPAGS